MDKAKAYRILRSFADGIVPAKYKATVERWLLSGKDSDAVDEAMQKIWEETSAQPDESTARSLQQFQSRRRHTLTPTRHTFGMRRMMRYAAIIVLILMTGAAVWMYTSNHYAQSEKMLECYVPNGKIDTLQLSDGTSVIINSGSTVLYPKKFRGAVRRIYLLGEAHFAVTKDASHPFIVRAGRLNVQVLGTHFNVRAYSGDDKVTTTLEEGMVKLFDDAHQENACILHPNEMAVYDRQSGMMQKDKVNAKNYSQWTDGSLHFENQTIRQIITILSHHFDVSIQVDTSLDAKRAFTMDFKQYETIDDVLTVLTQLSGDMSYQKDGRIIKLLPKKINP
jgi:transmembrane sensor